MKNQSGRCRHLDFGAGRARPSGLTAPIAPACTRSPALTVASILVLLAVASPRDPLRLGLHLARLGELRHRRHARLVGHARPCRPHHLDAERRALAGDGGADDELRSACPRGSPASPFASRPWDTACRRRPRGPAPSRRSRPARRRRDEGIAHPVDVPVVQADRGEPDARLAARLDGTLRRRASLRRAVSTSGAAAMAASTATTSGTCAGRCAWCPCDKTIVCRHLAVIVRTYARPSPRRSRETSACRVVPAVRHRRAGRRHRRPDPGRRHAAAAAVRAGLDRRRR